MWTASTKKSPNKRIMLQLAMMLSSHTPFYQRFEPFAEATGLSEIEIEELRKQWH